MEKQQTAPPVRNVTLCGTPLAEVTVVTHGSIPTGLRSALDRFVDLTERATGIRLPVTDEEVSGSCIAVGIRLTDSLSMDAALAEAGREGYAIVAVEGNLYITANSERGVIYGLYAFLERFLGWHFLSSGYEVVHPADGVDIHGDTRITDRPYFFSRDTLWWDTQRSGPLSNALRLNGNFARDVADFGGGINYGGRFVHSICELAEVSGEVGNQPCLTDEKTFETVRRNVRKILSEHPETDIISVSQNDSYAHQMGCQCENCRAIDEREGTPMGSLLTFVNRIADDIRDDYPDVLVDTLAYRYTRKAPKTVRPAPNVLIRLCSIECCFSHPIADKTCERNAAFCRDIEEWSAICDKLYIWDYTTDFAQYLIPYPNFQTLKPNVQFFRDNHVVGVFEQGNYNEGVSGELGELRAYLLANLLWNPEFDTEAGTAAFLSAYYGGGAPYVKQYIDFITDKVKDVHFNLVISASALWNDRISEDELAMLDRLWADAYAAALAGGDVPDGITAAQCAAHVERSGLCHRWFKLDAKRGEFSSPAQFEAQCDLFYRDCRRLGVKNLSEGSNVPWVEVK